MKLLRLRDTLVDSISGITSDNHGPRVNGSEAPAFVGDRADEGNYESERDFAMTLLSQENDALTEIEQALNRMEAGTYGVCEISGKPIPRSRLEAIPFARYTVECQAQLEKQHTVSRRPQRVPSLFEARAAEEEPEETRQEEMPGRGKRRKGRSSSEAERHRSLLTPSPGHSHYPKFIYETRI